MHLYFTRYYIATPHGCVVSRSWLIFVVLSSVLSVCVCLCMGEKVSTLQLKHHGEVLPSKYGVQYPNCREFGGSDLAATNQQTPRSMLAVRPSCLSSSLPQGNFQCWCCHPLCGIISSRTRAPLGWHNQWLWPRWPIPNPDMPACVWSQEERPHVECSCHQSCSQSCPVWSAYPVWSCARGWNAQPNTALRSLPPLPLLLPRSQAQCPGTRRGHEGRFT